MTPMKHIRCEVFGLTQAEFAGLIHVSQPTVSRWESETLQPSLPELGRIRSAAKARGLSWSDAWLFEVPAAA